MSVDRATIAQWMASLVAEALEIEPADVDFDLPLSSLGLGSRDLIALSGELEARLGRPLSPTLMWEFPTIALLAGHLAQSHPSFSEDHYD